MAKPFEAKVKTRWTLRPPKVVAGDVAEALIPPLINIAQDAQAEAVKLSPKKTGHNARSIGYAISVWGSKEFGTLTTKGPKLSAKGKKSAAERVTIKLESASGYGGFIELGTRFMPARPYLKPAIMNVRPRIRKHLAAMKKML